MLRITRYVVMDVLRNRWVIAYAAFFLIATDVLIRLGGTGPRALVSLLNVVLLLIPLVTIVFGTIYWHGAREFNELLLTQPVDRSTLFHGLFAGLVLPLSAAFVLGTSIPLFAHRVIDAAGLGLLAMLLIVGVALTAIFGAIAVLVAGLVEDRLRGLAVALGVWLAMAVAWDGGLMWVAVQFRDYPVETPLLALSFLNPIDLARIAMVLRLDVAALMGHTGAIFQTTLGGTRGTVLALGALVLWALVPGLLALRAFRRRDF
jgi:Cu-processing system permease protein